MLGVYLLGTTLIILFVIALRRGTLEKRRGWRIRVSGSSLITYSEHYKGNWRSITFHCDRYAKSVPRHAVRIPENWNHFPDWAQQNKTQILSRLKEVLRTPEYTLVEASIDH